MAFRLKTDNHLYERGLDKNSSVFKKHEAGHTETTTSGEWGDWKQDPNDPTLYTRNRTNTTTTKTGGKGNTGVSYEESYDKADKSKYPTLDSWKKEVDSYNKGGSSTSSNVETETKRVAPKMDTVPSLPPRKLPVPDPEIDPIEGDNYRVRKPYKPSIIDKIKDIDLIPGTPGSRRGYRRRTGQKIKRGLRRLNPFKPRRKGPCWYN